MVKQKSAGFGDFLAHFWGIIAWLTGVIVSLAVGFGLVNDVLNVKYVPLMVTEIAGWIVIILSLLGLVLAIVDWTLRR